jgi:putative Mg2+ transporter-C (MgtC) family protein
MDFVDIILRLFLAFIMGGIIGAERQLHRKAAGLRTHTLVCVGSTLMMLISIFIYYTFKEETNIDPSRIVGHVISGIGFLGAGTIIVTRGSIRGLTTAATLWATAAVGLAIGCGFYLAAMLTTVIIILALICLGTFEEKFLLKEKREYIDDETQKTISNKG